MSLIVVDFGILEPDLGSICAIAPQDSEYLVDWRALPWGEELELFNG